MYTVNYEIILSTSVAYGQDFITLYLEERGKGSATIPKSIATTKWLNTAVSDLVLKPLMCQTHQSCSATHMRCVC